MQSLATATRPDLRILHSLSAALHANRGLMLLVAAHTAVAVAMSAWLGLDYANGTAQSAMTLIKYMIPLFVIVLLIWRMAYGIAVVRPASPIRWMVADIAAVLGSGRQMLSGLLALALMMLFLNAFSLIKDMVPVANPFSWDVTFADMDRTLHGGVDPYRLLWPLTGTPLVTTVLNAAYHFWFFLNFFLLFVACFSPFALASRRTFLVSYVLTWAIGGNLLAILLSSAGPVYYHALGLGDAYVPLMDTLREFSRTSPVWALEVQERLWASYTGAEGGISGISAMPSMHVASTVTMMLYAFSWRRWAGWMMVPFTLMIMIGSVALGWHYALDGYLGAVVAVAVWFGVRAMQRRFAA